MSATYPQLTGTNFPDQKDAMARMEDLGISDLPLAQQYYTILNSGNLNAAIQFLVDNPQLNSKIFNAQKFNALHDKILAMQYFFQDDITNYMTNIKQEIQDDIDTFTDVGDYFPSVQYYKKNIVQYNGCAYICRQDCIGQDPVYNQTTAYWQLVARGVQGASGTGLTPRGGWDAATQYYANDFVVLDDQWWQCLADNINSEPSGTNTNWYLLFIATALRGSTWGDFLPAAPTP